MPNVRLTALSVERAFRNDPRFLLNDGDGLYLRKQANSGASWTLRYRFAERNRWMTLGHYPDMNLAAARAEARAKRILLDKHQDPLDERRAALQSKREANDRVRSSFKALADEWFETEIRGRIKHPLVPQRYITKHLIPAFGSKRPSEITPAEAARLLGRVSRTAPTAANDLLRFMRRIFRFGVRRHLLSISPVADFDARRRRRGTPPRACAQPG